MRVKRVWRNALAAVLLVVGGTAAMAGTTEAFTFRAQDYPGSRDRQYKVYVPDGLRGPAPLVMALHGCQQTEDDVLRDWGLAAAAERYGFILVAPRITSYDGLRNSNCWGFWLDAHQHEGRGEPEDLHRIAREVEGNFSIDPARRYITGLSSGGAMTVVGAVAHNEYWAAAASVAGLPYGEDSASVSLSGQCPGRATFHPVSRVVADMQAEIDDPYPIPLLVVQNNADCTVVQPAGRNLRDAQLTVFGSAGHDTPALARQMPCTPVFGDQDYGCRHSVFTTDGKAASRSVVETVFYDGPQVTPNSSDTDHGHYWIGGEQGRDGKWSIRRGPSFPDIAWNFFERHPRNGAAAPGGPRITIAGANPLRLEEGQMFVDPGASASDPEDGALPVSADCSSVDIARPGRYACTYSATDSAGNTASASRAVEVVTRGGSGMSCAPETASPGAHIVAGRASANGWFFAHALSTGDRQDIGYSWNFWSRVMLYEGEPGRWYARVPRGCAG